MAVEGLEQLDAAINKMVRDLSGNQLKAAVEVAGKEILQEVLNRAPVKSGALRASIEEIVQAKSGHAATSIQVAHSKRGGIKHYAVFIEYGTSKMPARPFMRTAFEASKQAAVVAFTNEIAKAVRG